jgi:hypothetical protein
MFEEDRSLKSIIIASLTISRDLPLPVLLPLRKILVKIRYGFYAFVKVKQAVFFVGAVYGIAFMVISTF